MKGLKRDIIILRRETFPNAQSIEHEVMHLNAMLHAIENSDMMLASFELIDLNRFRVISKLPVLAKSVKATKQNPFEFLINKN